MRDSFTGRSRLADRVARLAAMLGGIVALGQLAGCNLDSFFDPSRQGYFERYPTSIDVLDRIDVIEPPEEDWQRSTRVLPEDLIPSDLAYYIYPGDLVTVSVFELYTNGIWSTSTRRIDAGGFYRVPELGDVKAAGLTPQQFEDLLTRLIHERIMANPQVDVVVEEGGGLRYTVGGAVNRPGMFTLQNPDLRLLDALAIAGGVPSTTEFISVVRTVPLTDEVLLPSDQRTTTPPEDTAPKPQVDIEELIDQMDPNRRDEPRAPEPVVPDRPDGDLRLGMVQDPPREQPPAPVDVDDLEPARRPEQRPPVDVDAVRPAPDAGEGDAFIYDAQRGEWVRVRREGLAGAAPADGERPMVAQRIVKVDYQRLKRGDTSLNMVIRPNDYIYAGEFEQGLVYIGGEVNRPGVYQLPVTGRLTLSRAVTSAGGLGAIAVPSRVDLTRSIGTNREATVTLDLAAIMHRTEPDVLLKADDHIIVGTTWWATPLAVIRSGFRATYGFGFVLDRNFAEDVFSVEVVNN